MIQETTENKFTLVIGASLKGHRYSNQAINLLRNYDIQTAGIGLRSGMVSDVELSTEKEMYKYVHTVTLYLNAKNQAPYQDYILSLKPKRVIFNPGAENRAFAKVLEENGIQTLEACTLVMLRTNQF